MTSERKYLSIVASCEGDIDKYGDNYLGAGWTKKSEYADVRYAVMLDVMKGFNGDKISLLDFGCGTSRLYEYILRNELDNVAYSGLDLSERLLKLASSKFPTVRYYHTDILENPKGIPEFDYIILNGVFNARCDLSFAEMLLYFRGVVRNAFQRARTAIAFNVMSKYVDWEREDLFHLAFDDVGSFVTKELSKRFTIRHDYGLYEYTVYVYR